MIKKRVDNVLVRNHKDDREMIELYTVRSGKTIVWGCMHSDMLDCLHGKISQDDLDNADYKLVIHTDGGRRPTYVVID
tara:strand:- start:229 stop:462 length:234 start_codon:yes stop_codon:yes gene_type:complete